VSSSDSRRIGVRATFIRSAIPTTISRPPMSCGSRRG
jgi:hypothetical protein